MLDIKKLRDNFEEAKVALKRRGFDIDQEQFQSLDKKRKVLQVDVENLQADKPAAVWRLSIRAGSIENHL